LREKVTVSSIVLSPQFCEVYFISHAVTKPLWDLTTTSSWNHPRPPDVTYSIHPWIQECTRWLQCNKKTS